MLRAILTTLVSLSLASLLSASPESPPRSRQLEPSHLASLTSDDPSLPFVGAPLGPFYKSTKLVTCDPIRVTFGGGSGPTYFLAVVNGSSSALPNPENATAVQDPDAAQTFVRLGLMGIPGLTWWDLNASADEDERLEIGTEVALQVVDGMGNVGYSLPRKILKGHPNEFCYYPGAIWPPSRWDGTHYSAILLFLFLVVPFSITYLTGQQARIKDKANSIFEHLSIKPWIVKVFPRGLSAWFTRRRNRRRGGGGGDETEGALQLEERLERGEIESGEETHVLGGGDDDDDDEEEEESSRPLLINGERGSSRRSRANSLPPGYEEATKEDSPEPEEERRTIASTST